MTHNNATKKLSLLNKLRRAVKKLNVILSSTFKYSQWSLISILRAPSSARRRYTRHLSFNDELGIYNGCSEDVLFNGESNGCDNRRDLCSFRSFGRMSYNNNYGTEDIDRRADLFIENFHRQLRMERQISLELRYCNNNDNVSNLENSVTNSRI
ncbi:uncharacterized protein LOC110705808 [Chenopodium quinoa]|uniref:Uncharacterized protein n=1 Tax=Chenopodium quinoa TaxID=63459 RepID=A0A803LB32_CHEQI|nr:uncharacterized protein LOC110705808 [Chenopodium quinoa]